jgi:hypothetical protein
MICEIVLANERGNFTVTWSFKYRDLVADVVVRDIFLPRRFLVFIFVRHTYHDTSCSTSQMFEVQSPVAYNLSVFICGNGRDL